MATLVNYTCKSFIKLSLGFVIYSYCKDDALTVVKTDAKAQTRYLKLKGYHLPKEGIRKGTFSVKNGI